MSYAPTLVTPDLGTPSALVGTNITGTAAGLTAGNVTTNANLTGDVTSIGNATTLSNTAVTAATYGSATSVPIVSVDAKGRITGVTNTPITGTSPVGSSLTSGKILIGDASNLVAAVTPTGDVTITNAGGTEIGAGKVTNSMLTGSIDLTTKITGTLPVANGGTGVTTATGTGNTVLSASPALTGTPSLPTGTTGVTQTAGNNTTALATTAFVTTALTGAVRDVTDEFTATASQTSFTLTQTKSDNSKVKMFINGIRISNTAYSVTGTTLTYVPANNGSYSLSVGDRVQLDYYY